MKNEKWKKKNEKISNILFSNNFKKFFYSVKNERCGFDSCEKCIHFLIVEKTCFFTWFCQLLKKFLFLKKMKAVKKALMFEKRILIFLIFWNIM